MFSDWFELGEKPYTDEDAAWDDFVAAHPHGSILQTTNWARLKNRFGWSSHRVWLKQEGRFVAGAQILYRSAALGIIKIGYIPHGPLVDWQDPEQVDVLFGQIDQSAYQHGAGLVKMEPFVWQEEMPPQSWQALIDRERCVVSADTIQPPRTIMVDLRPSEDDILAAMKQKTRYNIRLAARKGVDVREGTAADMPAFLNLLKTTAERDDFSAHAPAYYSAAYDLLAPGRAVLLLAEYERHPLAAAFVTRLGQTASYLYGASSNLERSRMPTYAVQWAAMRWAKERGCTQYDLWGVPDFDEAELESSFTEREDGLWPVYRAKRGYGGRVQRTVGAIDRVYNQRLQRVYSWWRQRGR